MFDLLLIYQTPSFRHRDKDTEFVTLCKSLHVTDLVCDNAWMLWKTVEDSVEELNVCIIQKPLWWKSGILLLLINCGMLF